MLFKESDTVILQCSCGCSMLVVERHDWGENRDTWYSFSLIDSKIYNRQFSLWNRIKSAVSALLGQPVYWNDVCVQGRKEFGDFLHALAELISDEQAEDREDNMGE